MEKKSLAELIYGLEQEMLRLGYTNGSLQFYRRRWKMLLQFAQKRDELFYSERLGIDFVAGGGQSHIHSRLSWPCRFKNDRNLCSGGY